jgi:hypothetical protein
MGSETGKERVLRHSVANLQAEDIIYEVHKAMVPMKNTFLREAGRMKNALKIVEGASRTCRRLTLPIFMNSCAIIRQAWLYRLNLRQGGIDARGKPRSPYREDFSDRDDKNWLKWVIIQEKMGCQAFSEPVPIENTR